MAASLPRQLKAFNLYTDGESFAGRIDTFTPPSLAFLMEAHRAGGMDAPKEIEMGMEVMTATMVFSDYSPRLLSLLGKDGVPFVARGAVQKQGANPEPVIINMRGMLKTGEHSDWNPGAKSTNTFTLTLDYYRFRQNGVQLAEIDILNMQRTFGEEDQLAALRAAIGL
ncbi:phage major tail tube protein [Ensifer sp. LCM 4579]|uniref:phage major tail tube protein n=1 Tax=Ensifer sp. LCM 4579 TaxID=1848292 RepID=UPI0008D9D6EF|nr:phage major tail tube protein [Ensifer sp. LCM 4579]OHV85811.1 phage major tail tube protein [Ensifer sp. LCM 4579]